MDVTKLQDVPFGSPQSSQTKCVDLVGVGLQKVPELEVCMIRGFSQVGRTIQLFGGPEKRIETKQQDGRRQRASDCPIQSKAFFKIQNPVEDRHSEKDLLTLH
jgi:hypothetical protein